MSLLIKNVRVLGRTPVGGGGSGSVSTSTAEPTDLSDVFVVDNKIAAIGKFPEKRAEAVLDGQGAFLSPGFIDVNTDSDHYLTLFEYPAQEDFLRQGVTTIFGGMCGSSLAPLLYGTLESVRKWGGSEDKINVNWHTVGEFLATIDRRPFAVNFGTLVGHGTVRRALVAGNALRALTKNELAVFGETLQKSMGEGAFGMSTSLGSVHSEKAAPSEIGALAKIVHDRHGIYAAHLRKTGAGIHESITETIKLAKETGAAALVNHFVPMRGAEKDYEQALAAIEALPADMDFHFDIYPFDALLLPFYTFLPDWVRLGGFEVMLANIQQEWLLPKIFREMEPLAGDRFTVAQAPGNDFLVGKSLEQLRDMYGVKDAREALLKLMVATKMRGVALYRNLNAGLVRKALVSKRALIASNAASFDSMAGMGPSGEAGTMRQLKSERTTSTFTKFLTLAARDELMPLADAVRKITYEPARKMGLLARGGKPGRGEMKEGNYADLTCFKIGEKETEVRFTVVNGKVAMKEGVFSGAFAGRALRHI